MDVSWLYNIFIISYNRDKREAFGFFIWRIFILRNHNCDKCILSMKIQSTDDNKDGYHWKCYGRKCWKSTKCIRIYSFFQNKN